MFLTTTAIQFARGKLELGKWRYRENGDILTDVGGGCTQLQG